MSSEDEASVVAPRGSSSASLEEAGAGAGSPTLPGFIGYEIYGMAIVNQGGVGKIRSIDTRTLWQRAVHGVKCWYRHKILLPMYMWYCDAFPRLAIKRRMKQLK